MFKFLKKLARDRRGNALVIAAAALPVVVGAAGLGTDTVQWVLWKRELQRAADSAALAGAYAEFQSGDETVSDAVNAHLTDNNHTGITLLSGYPSITYPADTANYTKAVQVQLAFQRRLSFSSLFLTTPPTITATGKAAMVNDGSYCLVGLNDTTDPSITVGGSSSVSMGCGAISDSTSPTASVSPNGAAYNFAASPVAGAGGMPSSINGATDIQPHHVPMPDPFAGKYSTDIPSAVKGKCKTLAQNSYTTTTGTGQNKVTTNHLYSYESKGVCYSGFKFTGNQTYYLDAGTYYLDSTDFDTSGGPTLIGTGVTIVLTGTTPGSLKTNGNTTIQLSAPTSGSYAKLLFIGTGTGTEGINGTNTSMYDGAMYFPNATVSFNGNTGQMTQCALVIADFLNFSGNATIQNDTSSCKAASQVQGKAVRLIG